jgi:hypothetical protein
MDKSECLVADWYTIGYEDGSSGTLESNISEYRKDCAQHQVVPNLAAYRKGHYEGSEQFCRERNGYALGKTGYEYKRSCPHDLEDSFLAGYQDGQQVHSLKKIANSLQSQLTRTERQIINTDNLIIENNELIIADGLVREQRLEIRDELVALDESIIQLEQELIVLEERSFAAVKKYKHALQLYDNKTR